MKAVASAEESRRHLAWLAVGIALLIGVAAISLGVGAVAIAPSVVTDVLGARLGIDVEVPAQADAVVWGIRMPRLLTGLVVGAGLGVTGAALQGLYRNPLADPQLLGIAPGAALGAAVASSLGGTAGAIGGGAAAGVLSALVVRRLGSVEAGTARLILTGVAFGAVLSAWVGFVVFAADRTRVPPLEFWLLGSLTGATWRVLGTAVVLVVAGSVGIRSAARTLDLLTLGEHEARHLGVDVDIATTMLSLAVGLVVGATVGAVGVIGFVGLLVPHIGRRLVGAQHAHLLMASAVGGAVFVAGSDVLARTVVMPVEIPVGLLTAAIGGPFFIWLLSRDRVVA